MANSEIKDYLSRVGIRKIAELDTALVETFGPEEGGRHIARLTALFDQSEERLRDGTDSSPYLRRQEDLTDYLNQNLKMSLLAASFYDRVFFRRAMEYLLAQGRYFHGEILDFGCGNGILTCFLALQHPDYPVTGTDLSENALTVAKELAEKLQISNVQFLRAEKTREKCYGTLLSCRTAHENALWKPLQEEADPDTLPTEELAKRHRSYAEALSSLVKPQGHLVSIERYGDSRAYAGLAAALEHAGLTREKGTHLQFSCRSGDETAVFQGAVFRKG